MAKTVAEIMNRELFCVVPNEKAGDVQNYLLALEISAAPVVDDDGRPMGFISLRDVAGLEEHLPVSRLMTTPAETLKHDTPIDVAAERFAVAGRHHMAVVRDDGRVTGFLGSLDVIRAMVGKPVPHPEAFPHYDRANGLTWSNDAELSLDKVSAAPDGPGVYILVRSKPGETDAVVWSEASHNVRTRLVDLLSIPQSAPPHLAAFIDDGTLRFRAASTTPDQVKRVMDVSRQKRQSQIGT